MAGGGRRLCCLKGPMRIWEGPSPSERGGCMTPGPQPSPSYFGMCRCRRRCGELSTASPRRGWGWGRGERLLLHYFYTPLAFALSCAPGGRGGEEGRGGPRGCAGSGTPPWRPPSPVRPCVQPGRSTSHALLSQLAQASGKLGQVPRAGPGSPIPIPREQAAIPVLPLPVPAGQAAQILPSSFPGISGLQAVPAVVVAGDMPHGHPVPSTLMTAGTCLRSSRARSCCWDVSSVPATRPGTSPCAFRDGASLGVPLPCPTQPFAGHVQDCPEAPGDTGLLGDTVPVPIFQRADVVAAPAPFPRPPCSRDLLSKSRKK